MLKQKFVTTVISILSMLLMTTAAWAVDTNTRAMELASEQKFDEALSLLSGQEADIRNGYDHRFLKARILSWNGQYDEAYRELDALMAEFPNNADLQLALANLEYYQGNLDAAEENYQIVVDQVPTYTDARTGLGNVRKARKVKLGAREHPWRLDTSANYSSFEDTDLSNWNEQFFSAEYAPGKYAYHGSVQRYRRFDATDVEFRAGISDAVRGGWDWGLEVGGISDASFRPDFSVGGRLGHAIDLPGGVVIYPNLNYRLDSYSTTDIHNFQPDLTAYLKNGVILTGRLIGTVQSQAPDQLGWLIEGRVPVHDKWQLRAGFANAPEAVDSITITTQNIFGGMSYAVSETLDFHLNYVRDDREDVYIRNNVSVGFTHRR